MKIKLTHVGLVTAIILSVLILYIVDSFQKYGLTTDIWYEAVIVRSIMDTQTIPVISPFTPYGNFDYPVGHHILLSLIGSFSNIDAMFLTRYMNLVLVPIFMLVYFLWTKENFDKRISLFSVIILFFTGGFGWIANTAVIGTLPDTSVLNEIHQTGDLLLTRISYKMLYTTPQITGFILLIIFLFSLPKVKKKGKMVGLSILSLTALSITHMTYVFTPIIFFLWVLTDGNEKNRKSLLLIPISQIAILFLLTTEGEYNPLTQLFHIHFLGFSAFKYVIFTWTLSLFLIFSNIKVEINEIFDKRKFSLGMICLLVLAMIYNLAVPPYGIKFISPFYKYYFYILGISILGFTQIKELKKMPLFAIILLMSFMGTIVLPKIAEGAEMVGYRSLMLGELTLAPLTAIAILKISEKTRLFIGTNRKAVSCIFALGILFLGSIGYFACVNVYSHTPYSTSTIKNYKKSLDFVKNNISDESIILVDPTTQNYQYRFGFAIPYYCGNKVFNAWCDIDTTKSPYSEYDENFIENTIFNNPSKYANAIASYYLENPKKYHEKIIKFGVDYLYINKKRNNIQNIDNMYREVYSDELIVIYEVYRKDGD